MSYLHAALLFQNYDRALTFKHSHAGNPPASTEVMREVRKLMADPDFAEQIKAMSSSPHFKEAMSESAAMMEGIMKDRRPGSA